MGRPQIPQINMNSTRKTNMKNDTIAVIGASGKTGSRVLERLSKLGYRTRGLSRNSHPTR